MKKIIVEILNILSKRILAKYDPIVIGITGSVGKSSTKKAVYEVLKRKYNVACTKSNHRTDLSIPLAIIGLENGGRSFKKWFKIIVRAFKIIVKKTEYPEILILEMGVDRPNDMKKMLKILKPDIGIMTSIGKFPSHTKYFKDAKHIAREKFLLIKSLGKKDLAILNCDDEYINEMSIGIKAEKMAYGFCPNKPCPDAVLRAEEVFLGSRKWKIESGQAGIGFKISYKGTTVPFRLSYALGRSHIYATLCAAAVGIHFGLNLVEISEILSNYQPLAGRMKIIKGMRDSIIIDDTFNANPSSVLSALETFGKLEALRKIAVLSDMLELGEYCESGHREAGRRIPGSADLLFTFGARSKYIFDQAIESGFSEEKTFHFDNKEKLTETLKNTIKKGDIILVKGSRAMHMEKVVRGIMERPELADKLLVREK